MSRAASQLLREHPPDALEAIVEMTEVRAGVPDAGNVVVYWSRLPTVEGLNVALSVEETERANRLVPAARRRFVAGRTLLRLHVAGHLGVRPEEVDLSDGPGRPRLGGPQAASGLTFSLSHSGELVTLAIARFQPVGVDVEQLRPVYGRAGVERWLRRVIALDDAAAMDDATILGLWTQVEAAVKLHGEGFAFIGRAARAAHRSTQFCPFEGYVGSIATYGQASVWHCEVESLDRDLVPLVP